MRPVRAKVPELQAKAPKGKAGESARSRRKICAYMRETGLTYNGGGFRGFLPRRRPFLDRVSHAEVTPRFIVLVVDILLLVQILTA